MVPRQSKSFAMTPGRRIWRPVLWWGPFLVIVGALVFGGFMWGPGWLERVEAWRVDLEGMSGEERAQSVMRVAVPCLVVVAVIAGLVWLVVERRRDVRERLRAAAASVTGEPVEVRVLLWRWPWQPVRARRLLVRSGPVWSSEKPGAVAALSSALRIDTGTGWVKKRGLSRSRFILVPAPEQAEAQEEEREWVEDLIRKSVRAAGHISTARAADGSIERIEVEISPDPRLADDAFQARIENAIGAHLSGRWRARWDLDQERTVVFSPVTPMATFAAIDPKVLDAADQGKLVYGVAEDGSPHYWDLTGPQPHALVVGPTGSGKTSMIRSLTMAATRQGIEVVGCDPKRIELMGLRDWPGVSHVATTPEDMHDLILEVHGEMMRRYALIESHKARADELDRLIVILDEFLILRGQLNRHWSEVKPKGGSSKSPTIELIWDMAALARSARIHLVLGIQRPDAEIVAGFARDNFRHRVACMRLSAQGALMMWEDTVTGTDLPHNVQGRVIASGPQVPHEVQVFYTPDPDPWLLDDLTEENRRLVESLRPAVDIPITIGPRAKSGAEAAGGSSIRPPAGAESSCSAVDEGARSGEAGEQVRAHEVLAGDRVAIDGGEPVEVLSSTEDEDGTVFIEWANGEIRVESDEVVERFEGQDPGGRRLRVV